MWNHTGGTTSVGFLASPSFFFNRNKKSSLFIISLASIYLAAAPYVYVHATHSHVHAYTLACITYAPPPGQHATPRHAMHLSLVSRLPGWLLPRIHLDLRLYVREGEDGPGGW